MSTPILDSLKRSKQSKTVLVQQVEDWISENEPRLNRFNEDDWTVLKQLVVGSITRDPEVFSPSGATHCRREQVLNKIPEFKTVQKYNARQILFFDDGNWRHLRWQMLFYKMGIVESMELFKRRGKLDWGGTTDVITLAKIRIKGKLRRVVIDIKGANASKWNHIRDTGRADWGHWVQIQIYLLLHGIKYAILWYENKNTNAIHEVVIKADKKFHRKSLSRSMYMRRYVEAEAFPPEECDVGNTKDKKFRNCRQNRNCPCLPVHYINPKTGEKRKVAEPRKTRKRFKRHNTLPLRTLSGRRGARTRLSKK